MKDLMMRKKLIGIIYLKNVYINMYKNIYTFLYYRLIKLNNIGKYTKRKVVSDQEDDSKNSNLEENITINDKSKSSILSKSTKDETDKREIMMKTIENIDKSDSGNIHFIIKCL